MLKIKKYEVVFLPLIGLLICLWLASATLFNLVGEPVSSARPWSILKYLEFRNLKEFWIAVGVGFSPLLLILLFIFMPKKKNIFGDARYATESEIKKAGLRAEKGIIYGKANGKYLISNEPLHSVICAPTRSGKGVGIVIPNGLNFDGSMIVYDLKFENFEKTSGFRKSHGHQVFLWAPMSPEGKTHAYNPLDMIRDSPLFRISDVQNLASYLIPLPAKDPIWDQLARYFFSGLVLYVLDRKKEKNTPATIGEIYRLLNEFPDLQAWAQEAAAEPWLDPQGRRLILSFAGMSEKERSFVKTSIAKCVNLWANPLVDAATSKTDFDLRELRKKRISIYIGVTNDSQDVLAPLLALFFQQAIGILVRQQPKKDEPHKVLMLMDEFASMGKMTLIENAFTMAASYGIRLMIILQSLSTLDKHYGKEGRETILQNCAYQIYYAASDKVTTDYVVFRLGKKTITVKSKTKNKSGGSESTSQQAQDLMLPQDFQGLDRSKAVMLIESNRPILADKIRYYEDKNFMARDFAPSDVPQIMIASQAKALVDQTVEAAKAQAGASSEKAAEAESDAARALLEGRPVAAPPAPVDPFQIASSIDDSFERLRALCVKTKATDELEAVKAWLKS